MLDAFTQILPIKSKRLDQTHECNNRTSAISEPFVKVLVTVVTNDYLIWQRREARIQWLVRIVTADAFWSAYFAAASWNLGEE
ncbi:hypothetical protein ACEN2T_23295 [Pseudomonas sp. W22_MBD1_FP4]|uniref:hypothetical protein n=1 Tax=Pseudomonas sp. W22_MBD1_FP4 TaxID=3240272 RepID=UPI003F956D63